MSLLKRVLLLSVLSLCTPAMSRAELRMSNVFTDHMVLQRNQDNLVWGWDKPGTEVTVKIAGQSHEAKADDEGRWKVTLEPLPAGGPHQLTIAGSSERTLKDVLVGEVWLCSGQSNMAWPVERANDPKLEQLTASYPRIRLLSVPNEASQENETQFDGEWKVCSPETVSDFSAVGYFFGRQLHQTLDVPVGLIDNAWGGSAAEAWIQRDAVESNDRFKELVAKWEQVEATYDHEKAVAKYEKVLANWKQKAAEAKKSGEQPPQKPRAPRNHLTGNHRIGNLYGGCLHPIVGFGIQGVIWYQGESNASRAYQYRDLFPFMITHWREQFGQGDFPFYWVNLADFMREAKTPEESAWSELREAQTMTLSLPNTGQAIIIDLGEADDIHPRNKQDVAKRLARLALANEYGYDIVAHSPRYESHEIKEDRVLIDFQQVGTQLDTFDVKEPLGFAIAGEDRVFLPAEARIVDKDTIEVWSDNVANPVAVRYAWAENPVCNVQNTVGLPLTPFRTDDWEGVTVGKE